MYSNCLECVLVFSSLFHIQYTRNYWNNKRIWIFDVSAFWKITKNFMWIDFMWHIVLLSLWFTQNNMPKQPYMLQTMTERKKKNICLLDWFVGFVWWILSDQTEITHITPFTARNSAKRKWKHEKSAECATHAEWMSWTVDTYVYSACSCAFTFHVFYMQTPFAMNLSFFCGYVCVCHDVFRSSQFRLRMWQHNSNESHMDTRLSDTIYRRQ